MAPGYEFKTNEELEAIPRRHTKFPYCHPGPVCNDEHESRDWYYADSIVQEIKIVGTSEKLYNVRWISLNSCFHLFLFVFTIILFFLSYNTLEPECNVKGTAILILFQRRDIYTASRANGPLLLPRSLRHIHKEAMTESVDQNETMTAGARLMSLLDECLQQEQQNGRYLPEIGFYS